MTPFICSAGSVALKPHGSTNPPPFVVPLPVQVAPEHHNSVTIFFSDIVGFTDISRTMSPVDVMNMLDRLYVEFDNLAEREGVFKVRAYAEAAPAARGCPASMPGRSRPSREPPG